MPPTAATLLLAQVTQIREQLEGLDDPDRPRLLATLRLLKDQLEAVAAREQAERSRAGLGIGARPRFSRLR